MHHWLGLGTKPAGGKKKKNKPGTKGQWLHGSTFMRYLEELNLHIKKVVWWLPGAEEEWLMGTVSVWDDEKTRDGW